MYFPKVGGRTVAIQFVRAALELAHAKGYDTALPLALAGIPPMLIDEDAARVTEAQAARLVQALWEISDDELIGVGPKPVPRGTFRMMALAVIHAPDLDTALHRLVEFIRIGMGFADVVLAEDDQTGKLSFQSAGDDQTSQQVAAIFLAVVHRFAAWLIGRQIVLNSTRLPGAPPPNAAAQNVPYPRTAPAPMTWCSCPSATRVRRPAAEPHRHPECHRRSGVRAPDLLRSRYEPRHHPGAGCHRDSQRSGGSGG
ncbi:hypothetical protein BH11ACT6_BH11ACT6_52300 [soil metagenome]